MATTPTLPLFTHDSNSLRAARALHRRADSWVLARLSATPGHSRGYSVAIIASLVAVIGWLDYLSGIRISLVLFYLIPVVLSVAWLGWRAGYATAVTSVVVRVVGDLAAGGYDHPLRASWNRLIDLFMYFVVVWTMHALISLLREVDERVRRRTAALQQAIAERNQLQTELFEISRRERSDIGHDLHDGLGQHLTATSIAVNLLANDLAAGGHAAANDARTIVKMLQAAIGTTRKIARGLLLAAVEPAELLPELDELAAAFSREYPIACRFVHRGVAKDCLSVAVASHIFYIAQEAARNAARHAHAAEVDISLFSDKRILELAVIDNGRGLPPADARRSGIGLRIMAHRTELIGGEFTLGPGPDGGTAVRCRVPLPAAPPSIVAR
jgi:signal transduction histidine kinase